MPAGDPGQGLKNENYPMPGKLNAKGSERNTTQFLTHNKYIFCMRFFNYFMSLNHPEQYRFLTLKYST
jgi:hypothetical protein